MNNIFYILTQTYDDKHKLMMINTKKSEEFSSDLQNQINGIIFIIYR